MKRKSSQRRAQSVSTALFLLGLAIVSFTKSWWPNIMLVIGIPIAVRQYLLGRFHDMMISVLVFGGVYVTLNYEISWNILLPVIFLTAAIYVLFREFLETRSDTEVEKEEELNLEIEIEEFRNEK